MVRFLKTLFLSLLLVWGGSAAPAYAKKSPAKVFIPQYAAIVIEANSGRVWHEENADAKTYPASLTKMMTLYMLFEALETKKIKLSTRMKVSPLAVNQIPSKLGLRAGKTLRVQDAMFGLITKSANDASVVVAEHMAGSVAQFAQDMTKKARSLGMHNTIFKNPNGVPNKEQMTTARDMAILSRALYQRFPAYCRYFNTRSFMYAGQIHKNHNHLLGKVPGVDGIKTGYIAASGFNLAATAKRNGMRMIVVVMGGRSSAARNARVTELLENGFYLASSDKPKHNGKAVYLAKNDKKEIQKKPIVIQVIPENNPESELTASVEPLKAPLKLSSTNQSVFSVAHAADLPSKETTPRNWLIQVGAFKQAKLANLKVKEILKSSQLKGGKPSVATTNGRRKLFQARVINLTQEQAQKTCQSLKNQGGACFAVKNLNNHLNLALRR